MIAENALSPPPREEEPPPGGPSCQQVLPNTSLEGTSDQQVRRPLGPCSSSKTSPGLFSRGRPESNSEGIISTAAGCLLQSTRDGAHCLREGVPQHADGNKKECEV